MDNAVFTYQWLANDADIGGATNATYTLEDSEEGKCIRVKVSFTDDRDHQETLTSNETSPVLATPYEPSGSATWSATLAVGDFNGVVDYWRSTGSGALEPDEFDLDGEVYQVEILADMIGREFKLTISRAIPVDFTLRVSGSDFNSMDASVKEKSQGARYRWKGQPADLSDRNGVVVGQLARNFKAPAGMRCVSDTVLAVVNWDREKSESEYRDGLRSEAWEVVVPELVLEAGL